jgi:DNA-binding CsgD family transcriptional regulator
MSVSSRLRDSLFQLFAQCLMRQAEATNGTEVLSAVGALIAALPITWYAVDLLTRDSARHRLASHRCPRAFAEFIRRLGFHKRPDGVYPGAFAASTLLLVKVADEGGDRCLLCAIALPKTSVLNDGSITGCLGGVVRAALVRIIALEGQARRQLMLESVLDPVDDAVALFDDGGSLIERHSTHEGSIQSLLQPPRSEGRRRASWTRLAPDGRAFDIGASWFLGSPPLQTKYCLLRVRRRTGPGSSSITPWLQRYGLSKREAQVAELVFSGQTNQRIAEALFISRDTVKTHCRHIFGKLGISRRTEFLAVVSGSQVSSSAAVR